jgi:hypothetical protein
VAIRPKTRVEESPDAAFEDFLSRCSARRRAEMQKAMERAADAIREGGASANLNALVAAGCGRRRILFSVVCVVNDLKGGRPSRAERRELVADLRRVIARARRFPGLSGEFFIASDRRPTLSAPGWIAQTEKALRMLEAVERASHSHRPPPDFGGAESAICGYVRFATGRPMYADLEAVLAAATGRGRSHPPRGRHKDDDIYAPGRLQQRDLARRRRQK